MQQFVIDYFRKSGFMKELPDEELALLSDIVREENYDTGTTIFKEGDKGDAMFIVKDGQVKILKDMSPGKKLIATFGKNDIFGELSIFDEQARSGSAVAVTSVVVLKISATDLKQLMEENSRFGVHFLQTMLKDISKRLRDSTAKLRNQVVFGS